MKRFFIPFLAVALLASVSSARAQSTDKERLKANLERAFSSRPTPPLQQQASPDNSEDGILYHIQILSSVRPLEETGDKALKTFPDLRSYHEGRYLKYYTGTGTSDYAKALSDLRAVQAKGYPDAFVIAFKYGVKIPLKEALAQQGVRQ